MRATYERPHDRFLNGGWAMMLAMNVVLAGAIVVVVLALAQTVRLGIKRGDWSGLIPVGIIVGVAVIVAVLLLLSPSIGGY